MSDAHNNRSFGTTCFRNVLLPLSGPGTRSAFTGDWHERPGESPMCVKASDLPRTFSDALEAAEAQNLTFALAFLKGCEKDFSSKEDWLSQKRAPQELERYNYPTY